MARSKRRREVTLPWERRGAWLRGVLAGPRWKVALLVLALALGAWGIWRASVRQATLRETRAAISEMHRAIDAFRSEVGRCPRSREELLDPPGGARRVIREIPKDGWGRELWMRCPARHDPNGAEVVSAGPSGSFFVDDNVM